MPKRVQIGKRLRFSIFSRDEYTCRYCGHQPPNVTLHIDHVIPVSKGGTNDPENLVTSCVDCNLGKSNKPVVAPESEHTMLYRAQEMQEQIIAAERAKAAAQARINRFDELVDFWTEMTVRDTYHVPTLKVIFSYIDRYGEPIVYEWIAKAALAVPYSDQKMGKYISGIRRKMIENGELTDE